MQNFIKPGVVMTYTAPAGGVVSGSAYLIGQLLVVATNTVAATLQFEGDTEGVYSLPKATGIAWTEGMLLYWDNTAKNLTNVTTSNTRVGVAAAVGGALSGDTTGLVRLSGVPAVAGVA